MVLGTKFQCHTMSAFSLVRLFQKKVPSSFLFACMIFPFTKITTQGILDDIFNVDGNKQMPFNCCTKK